MGCATGLSSLALLRSFPGAHVTGVDLSPYMLAVGHHLQRKREVRARQSSPLIGSGQWRWQSGCRPMGHTCWRWAPPAAQEGG